MRPVLDQHLPEPYRAWIDKTTPMPEGVRLLPRSTCVAPMVRRLIFSSLVYAGLGILFIALVTATPEWVNSTALVFLLFNSVILFSVPLWTARRLVVTLHARNEQLAGVLRQGILVGTDGVLVRLEPDCCYPIPLGRFVRARQRCGDVDDGTDRLEIETRHGRTEVAADDLAVDAEAINQAVAFARRCGSAGLKSVVQLAVLSLWLVAGSVARADDFPKGTFKNKGPDGANWGMTFDGKGKLSVTLDDKEVVILDYKVTKDEIEFSNETGLLPNKAAGPGTYKWKLDGKKLTFTKVKDESEGRAKTITSGAWVKKE